MLRPTSKKNQRIRMIARAQRGVGLIEVLIAILIASFALLGLAGLQVTALRYQKVAQFRAVASQYSADIADRMRANVAGAKLGNYVTSTADLYMANTSPCPTGTSTPTALAAKDICEWRQALAQRAAGGWGEITGDTTAGFTAMVYFKEPQENGSTAPAGDKCRLNVLNTTTTDKDVRCFVTTFMP